MIVIGVDPHKRTHTAAAVDAATGELLAADGRGHATRATRSCSTGPARSTQSAIWALEDCRHVRVGSSASWSRRGERVVRVPPKLMAGPPVCARSAASPTRSTRSRSPAPRCGKGRDAARGAAGGPALEIKLLLDHREDLVAERTRAQNRLRWHLHDLDPELELPGRALQPRLAGAGGAPAGPPRADGRALGSPASWCAAARATRARRGTRARARAARQQQAPELLALPGCGRYRRQADRRDRRRERFSTTPSSRSRRRGAARRSSGRATATASNRSGNRQLNLAFHRIAVTQSRMHPPAKTYFARHQAEGKSRREAMRASSDTSRGSSSASSNSSQHPSRNAKESRSARHQWCPA